MLTMNKTFLFIPNWYLSDPLWGHTDILSVIQKRMRPREDVTADLEAELKLGPLSSPYFTLQPGALSFFDLRVMASCGKQRHLGRKIFFCGSHCTGSHFYGIRKMWPQPEAPGPGECGMRSRFAGTKVGKSVCGDQSMMRVGLLSLCLGTFPSYKSRGPRGDFISLGQEKPVPRPPPDILPTFYFLALPSTCPRIRMLLWTPPISSLYCPTFMWLQVPDSSPDHLPDLQTPPALCLAPYHLFQSLPEPTTLSPSPTCSVTWCGRT